MRHRARRQLLDRPRDPAGEQRRREPGAPQDQDGQQDQAAPGGDDLRLHPPAREPDAGRAPALRVDPDRHREVVEAAPVRPADLLGERPLGRQDAVEHGAGEERADDLRAMAVRRDPPVPVQDHRVGDVGLGGETRHVLLELRVVVEDQGTRGDGRQVARQRVAALLDLADDRLALPVLDDHHERAHDRGDDEQGPDQELGLERHEAAARRGDRARRGARRGDAGQGSSRIGSVRRHAVPRGPSKAQVGLKSRPTGGLGSRYSLQVNIAPRFRVKSRCGKGFRAVSSWTVPHPGGRLPARDRERAPAHGATEGASCATGSRSGRWPWGC